MGCCCTKNRRAIVQHKDLSDDISVDHIKNRIISGDTGI